MADNSTQLASDIIRDIDRLLAGIKTQVFQMDFGGDNSSAEQLVSVKNPFPSRIMDPDQSIAAGLTTLRDQLTVQRYTVVADSIADGLALNTWFQTFLGGGAFAITGGEGLLTANAASSLAQMVSIMMPYLPGQVHWLNSAIRFGDPGTVGNTRRVGVCTISATGVPQNGFYYELADTTLSAVVVKDGAIISSVAVASWSLFSTSPFTFNVNYHSFEIRYTANRADFYVDNALRHTYAGTTNAITSTLSLPIMLQTINGAATAPCVIGVRNIGLGRFGLPESQGPAGPLSQSKAHNSLFAKGDVAIPAMAIRKAVPGNTTDLEGAYGIMEISNGRLWTTATIDKFPQGDLSNPSQSEFLALLVAANLAQTTLLTQMLAVLRGRPDPLPGEEAEALISDYLDGRNILNRLL